MIIVIADDITGAAEIAGISLRYNLKTSMVLSLEEEIPKVDVLVIATNTRSYSKDKSITTINEIIKKISPLKVQIFKKTDSVLRGYVYEEIKAILDSTNYNCCLLLPQNPSKKRVIFKKEYLINQAPLNKTLFREDPEFPIKTSNVIELLGNNVLSLGVDDDLKLDKSIQIADATSKEEIIHQLLKAKSKNVLFAGSADLFDLMLAQNYKESNNQKKHKLEKVSKALFFCGSTQSQDLSNKSYPLSLNAKQSIMPQNIFDGESEDSWIKELKESYLKGDSLIISLGKRENGGSLLAIRLRKIMAKIATELVAKKRPDLIVIEGGATAYSILEELRWNTFNLTKEYAPGIVGLQNNKTQIILKPGSYPWEDLFN